MQKYDNPYDLFPKDKFHVHMVHLMPGKVLEKDSDTGKPTRVLGKKACGNSKFMTVLTVKPRHPNQYLNGEIKVTAKCGPTDTPSRKVGREVVRMKAQLLAQQLGWI